MSRTVLLCVDGGDFRVAQNLVASGGMPVTKRLLEQGSVVHMTTCADVMEPSVWGPILSGQPVGNVALVHFEEFDPATMGTTFRREATTEPLWAHLPGRGQGALSLDAPEIHPNPLSAAAEACCWHVHAPDHRPVFTDRGLKARLRTLGRPPRLANPTELSLPYEHQIVAYLEGSLRYRTRTLEAIGFERPFTCAGVHELHTAVHALGHHGPDPHWFAPERRDPGLLSVPYDAVDKLIGSVLERAAAANIVLVFARGGRPADHCGHLLEGLLERAGLLRRRLDAGQTGGERLTRPGLAERVRGTLPDATRERIALRVLPISVQHRLAARRFRDHYAWDQTQVFPVPSWTEGLLRINLAGREAQGIVAPHEAEPLIAAVRQLLAEMVDADSGRPLVHEAIRAQKRFPGTRAAGLPDLIVRWTAGRPPGRAHHPRLGTWASPPRPSPWTEHRAQAEVILAGPSVRAGVELDGDPLGLAPTVLALLGSRAPSVMPGEVWSDVLIP
jgi:predicted AlkP superfamily phosphohydrolase/phosphomutase